MREHAFSRKCRRWNIKLNPKEVKRCQSSVGFKDHPLTLDGLEADPEKILATLEMSGTGDSDKEFLAIMCSCDQLDQ